MNKREDTDYMKTHLFVGVQFNQNCQKGEDALNQAIREGYKIAESFRTDSGIVFSLVLDKQLVVEPNQRSLDYKAPFGRITKEEQK
jgi:hypothetical protein